MKKKAVKPSNAGTVYMLAIGLFAVSLAAAVALTLMDSGVVRELVVPQAMAIFSNDGVLEKETAEILDRVISRLDLFFYVFSGLALLYALIWRHFSAKLANRQHGSDGPWPRISRAEFCLVSMVLLVSIVLRVNGINKGLNYDEIWTATLFVGSDSWWIPIINGYSNNHPAYSFLAKVSQTLFGKHEWALRLPALVFAMITLSYLWLLGRRYVGPRIAMGAMTCLALAPIHVIYSQSARGYSGMILFTLVATCIYLRILRYPSNRDGVKFVLASVAGIYFHMYAAAVTFCQILFLLYLSAREVLARYTGQFVGLRSFRVLWLSIAGVFGISVLCYVPQMPTRILHGISPGGEGLFRPLFPIRVIQTLSGDLANSAWPVVVVVSLFVIFGCMYIGRRYPRQLSYFALLFFLPICIPWSLSPYWLYPRFFVFLVPYYMLLLSAGFFGAWYWMSERGSKWIVASARIGCVLLASYVVIAWFNVSATSKTEGGFRDAVSAMCNGMPDSRALCAFGVTAPFYQYYSDTKILIPQSLSDLKRILMGNHETRCAYVKTPWESPSHTEMARFLSENADVKQFGEVSVYTYQTQNNP